ncbi:MAG: hypothetical protein K5787_14215, partial [Lentisphaeria bacterium]|nr:hypothetical protein [Lentisphaeria bacterium]
MTHGRIIFTFAAMMACASCVFGGIQEEREAAMKLRADGNFKDAYDAFVKLLENPQNKGRLAAGDFNQAVNCLENLNRIGEYDALLKKSLDIRKNDWQFIIYYEYLYQDGYILDGKFKRGWNRGGQARHINVRHADLLFKTKLM